MFANIASLVLAVTAATTSVSLGGTFALQDGRARTQAHMIASQVGSAGLERNLDFWLTYDRHSTVSRYDQEMTKYLHVIAISDDFATFMHLHPTFESDHHFRLRVRFPRDGLYHVYADGEPAGRGRQVFRYDLRVGSPSPRARDVARTPAYVSAGPYRVSLGTTQLRLGIENDVALHISRNGKPASDLHPYLGALAHAVIVDARDLSYAHVHAMSLDAAHDAMSPGEMAVMTAGRRTPTSMANETLPDSKFSAPDSMLHVNVRRTGIYKMWLQFQGKDGLHVAPFILTAT